MKRKRKYVGFEEGHMDRLTEEIKTNGFDQIETGEQAISVRQLALLNWKNINEIKDCMVT